MSAPRIVFDPTKPDMQKLTAALRLLRDGLDALDHFVDFSTQTVNADAQGKAITADPASFALNASLGGYLQGDQQTGFPDANSAAKASFDEMSSLLGAMNLARAAIYQACAKHGV